MFHSVRDLSQASPRRGRCRGIRSREVRISSFRVHEIRDFYSSRSTRGDSARFLRTCEFEGSLVRNGRLGRVVIFSSPRKLTVAHRIYAKKKHPYNYWHRDWWIALQHLDVTTWHTALFNVHVIYLIIFSRLEYVWQIINHEFNYNFII